MFGTQGLWEAIKALIKTAALGTVVIVTSDRAQTLVSSAGALPLSAVAATFTDSAILMFRVVAITGLIIAIADYVVVRMKTMKKLKMSKYEITAGAQAVRGRPAHEGAPPRGRAVDVAQPDDERRRRGRRPAGQPHPRRRRAEVRPGEGRAAGGREGRRRGGRPAARHRRRRTGCRWCRTSRSPGPCTPPASWARRCRPSCSPRSPACWPSSCTSGARGVKGGFHRPGFEPPEVDGPAEGRTTPHRRLGRRCCPLGRRAAGDRAQASAGTGGARGCR